MSTKETNILSGVALFFAGMLAAGLIGRRREKASGSSAVQPTPADVVTADPAAVTELRQTVAEIERRLEGQESANTLRFGGLETRVEEHSTRLREVPSTRQIVDAVEQLLSNTMTSLDERLTTQAHSIEVLKTTVNQTDSLLERVLESLDSLQEYSDAAAGSEDAVAKRKAV
jgi:chromosome segregation ATPase